MYCNVFSLKITQNSKGLICKSKKKLFTQMCVKTRVVGLLPYSKNTLYLKFITCIIYVVIIYVKFITYIIYIVYMIIMKWRILYIKFYYVYNICWQNCSTTTRYFVFINEYTSYRNRLKLYLLNRVVLIKKNDVTFDFHIFLNLMKPYFKKN